MYQQQTPSWIPVTHPPFSMTQWTRYEDKLFEEALVKFSEDDPDRWNRIALHVPGKSPEEVKERYSALLHDVYEIDSGLVDVPCYDDDDDSFVDMTDWDSSNHISFESKFKESDPDRKKGTPWTEEEHRLFLVGLERYGKGDWRAISRNIVKTRTPTQIASHAQKFFLRQKSIKKERKRSSIHDITTVDIQTVPANQNLNPLPDGPVQQPPFSGLVGGEGSLG